MIVKAGTDTVGGMSNDDQIDALAQLSEEHLLGIQIASFREARNMSQSALADAMKTAGHRWSQSTVYKVENSERKLTFVEGFTLARILEVDPVSLVEPRQVAAEVIRVCARLQLVPLRISACRQEVREVEEWFNDNAGGLLVQEVEEIQRLLDAAKGALGGSEA